MANKMGWAIGVFAVLFAGVVAGTALYRAEANHMELVDRAMSKCERLIDNKGYTKGSLPFQRSYKKDGMAVLDYGMELCVVDDYSSKLSSMKDMWMWKK